MTTLVPRGRGTGVVARLALTVTLAFGCSGRAAAPFDGGTGGGAGPDGATGLGGAGNSGSVTYYKDVQPIVADHCLACHTPGGLAPFSLSTYEDARSNAADIAGATKAGLMPPWPPAPGCGAFRDERRLAPADVATLAAWREAGAPAGNPADARGSTPPKPGLGAPSARLDPGAAYQANSAVTDDYRCFLIDPGLTSAQDLIGFDVHPGTTAAVHHVLLFSVAPAQLAAAQAKDAAGPGIGWTCFGGTGVSSGGNGTPVIGGWVPGAGATAFPPPTGISLAAGTQVIMQIHYNLVGNPTVLDRTTADLFYASAPVSKPAAIRPIANVSFSIPAGMGPQTVTADLPIQNSWALWGVVPHMHLRGTKISLSIERAAGGSTCAIDIPGWDFHWQMFYYYQQPLAVEPGDTIRLSCTFDNTTGTTPLTWGESTSDEMCLSYLYFTAP